MVSYSKKGWYYEGYRHSLAARGISSSLQMRHYDFEDKHLAFTKQFDEKQLADELSKFKIDLWKAQHLNYTWGKGLNLRRSILSLRIN